MSPQAPPDRCQSLLTLTSQTTLQCETVGNCSGLQCPLTVGALNNYVASFTVTKCRDPVTVDLNIAGPMDADVQQTLLSRQFTRSEVVVLIGNSETISVTMSRNASHLTFQVDVHVVIIKVGLLHTFLVITSQASCSVLDVQKQKGP